MKISTALVAATLAASVASTPAEAQVFGSSLGNLRNKLENRVETEVDSAIDQALDADDAGSEGNYDTGVIKPFTTSTVALSVASQVALAEALVFYCSGERRRQYRQAYESVLRANMGTALQFDTEWKERMLARYDDRHEYWTDRINRESFDKQYCERRFHDASRMAEDYHEMFNFHTQSP